LFYRREIFSLFLTLSFLAVIRLAKMRRNIYLANFLNRTTTLSHQQFKQLMAKFLVVESETTELDTSIVLHRQEQGAIGPDNRLSHIVEYPNFAFGLHVSIAKPISPHAGGQFEIPFNDIRG